MSYGIPSIEDEKCEVNKLNQLILSAKVEEIVEAFEDNIELCVKYLLNLNNFFGYTNDTNFIIVETVFSQMLRLPKAKASTIFYSSLLVNLSKKTTNDKKGIHSIVVEVFSFLFKSLEEVDIECNERLTNFLSFYLSNMSFDFNFEIFKEISTLPKQSVKQNFFKQFMEKICCLIEKSKLIPFIANEDLQEFFPKDDKPTWKFNDPNETYYYDSQVICDNILVKKEYNSWVDKFDASGNDFVYIFMSCIFYCKSKTLSHLRESITLYKDAIANNLSSKDQQLIALEALLDVWGHSSVYFEFIFDLVLKFSFIDGLVGVKWIFDKLIHDPSIIPCSYRIFGMLNLIVNNCSNSIVRIQRELIKEQENIAKNEDGFQTNIAKNIETFEETLEKYFEIERKVYHEIVFVRIINNIRNS